MPATRNSELRWLCGGEIVVIPFFSKSTATSYQSKSSINVIMSTSTSYTEAQPQEACQTHRRFISASGCSSAWFDKNPSAASSHTFAPGTELHQLPPPNKGDLELGALCSALSKVLARQLEVRAELLHAQQRLAEESQRLEAVAKREHARLEAAKAVYLRQGG
ncbi:unnamed protein product [Amoebophrya sp. A120]|nr:unnamed protein product [Amoebophrya sp. A120]|eukprot:GSA120T00019999001.1